MNETAPFRYYASEISYFSGKVRPALRYKGIPFTELLPDVRGIILPRTGLAFFANPRRGVLVRISQREDEGATRVKPQTLFRQADGVTGQTFRRFVIPTKIDGAGIYGSNCD